MANIQFHDLDWADLWVQAKKKKNWRRKGAADWDKKAASFAKRTASSIYVDKFLALLNPQPEWDILDIGCGPGTLALPMADRCERVTAIDFSANMLRMLEERAAAEKMDNIITRKLSWQDDWQGEGIRPHTVAIASRSLAVPDLKKALERLNSFARDQVCITDRVQHGPMDPDAFKAVDRDLNSGPDYIYTVNLLYQMGYLPEVAYIRLEESLQYSSFDEAYASYSWMFRDLTLDEEKRLRKYVQSITTTHQDGTVEVFRRHVPTWAFISWKPGVR